MKKETVTNQLDKELPTPTDNLMSAIDEMMKRCDKGEELSIIDAFGICMKHMSGDIKSVTLKGEKRISRNG